MSSMMDDRWAPPAVLESSAVAVEIHTAGGVSSLRVLDNTRRPLTNETRVDADWLGRDGHLMVNLDRIAPYPCPHPHTVPPAPSSSPVDLLADDAVVLCSCGKWWQGSADDPLVGADGTCRREHRWTVLTTWDELGGGGDTP